MFIDDCIKGTQLIMYSDVDEPINLGSSELVSINRLVDIVEDIAGIRLKRTYDRNAPKGVNGRNSDNSMIVDRLGWEPSIRLRDGLEKTYRWIERRITEGDSSVQGSEGCLQHSAPTTHAGQLAYSSRA
jgi:nucleoside-diphosphate-sugar epimerase